MVGGTGEGRGRWWGKEGSGGSGGTGRGRWCLPLANLSQIMFILIQQVCSLQTA